MSLIHNFVMCKLLLDDINEVIREVNIRINYLDNLIESYEPTQSFEHLPTIWKTRCKLKQGIEMDFRIKNQLEKDFQDLLIQILSHNHE